MPGLANRVSSAEGLLKLIVGLIGAIAPAFAMLRGVVDVPPDIDDLIVWISGGIGLSVTFCVFLATAQIDAARNLWIAILGLLMVIAGASSAVGYRAYAASHIVSVPTSGEIERLVVPSNPSPELVRLIAPFGGDWVEALKTSAQRDRIAKLVEEQNFLATVTIIVLLIVAQTLTTFGLLIGLWKLAGSLRGSENEGEAANITV